MSGSVICIKIGCGDYEQQTCCTFILYTTDIEPKNENESLLFSFVAFVFIFSIMLIMYMYYSLVYSITEEVVMVIW